MNSGMTSFMILSFLLLGLFVAFFIYQITPAPPPERMSITCTNDNREDKRTVGILLDVANKEMIMSGEHVPEKFIRVFNETAIDARWEVGGLMTKVFIDRIAGQLEIITQHKGRQPIRNSFTCHASSTRF